MIDFFFVIIEVLATKLEIDASSSNFKTIIVTTIIALSSMVVFCIIMIILHNYWITIIMLLLMIGVYLFSENRIQELKEESRNVK